MGTSETKRLPLKLELKFDGQAAVSGTVTRPPNAGEIKAGTFDLKTGAMKFEVEAKGDNTRFVFEGIVVKGTAIGRVNGHNQTGNFKLTKGPGEAVATQQAGGNDVSAALRKSFGEVICACSD